jgi:hypothetical protein
MLVAWSVIAFVKALSFVKSIAYRANMKNLDVASH